MTGESRRRAYGRGRKAERLASWWLRLKGYRILTRRFRAPVGEIDLIARRGRILALVEVKARSSLAAASEAIGPRQRRRIERAATLFLQRNPALAKLDLRFDAILLVPGRRPHHIEDAWRAGSEVAKQRIVQGTADRPRLASRRRLGVGKG